MNDLKKLVPTEKVYDDLASPTLKQIGEGLASVAKASRFILAPLEYLAAQHDRWIRYLKRVSEKVPEQNLTPGHPQLVVPILEGLSYAEEGSILSELFVNLLARSVDREHLDLAHPGFPHIIGQISTDEAVVLYYLKRKPHRVVQQSDFDHPKHLFYKKRTVEEEFPTDKLAYPQHIWLYMDHLHSLNVAGTWQVGQQEYINDPATHDQVGVIIRSERRLTSFGRLFVDACVPDEFPGL